VSQDQLGHMSRMRTGRIRPSSKSRWVQPSWGVWWQFQHYRTHSRTTSHLIAAVARWTPHNARLASKPVALYARVQLPTGWHAA
jgi:hypothetical protein